MCSWLPLAQLFLSVLNVEHLLFQHLLGGGEAFFDLDQVRLGSAAYKVRM